MVVRRCTHWLRTENQALAGRGDRVRAQTVTALRLREEGRHNSSEQTSRVYVRSLAGWLASRFTGGKEERKARPTPMFSL